jgi:hypothetical protein
MDRLYQLHLHRDDRVGAPYRAELHRLVSDGTIQVVAEVDDDLAGGIQRIFERLVGELIDYRDEHGTLP